jgi:hypothetical protein
LFPRADGVLIGGYCARIVSLDLPTTVTVEFPRAALLDLATPLIGTAVPPRTIAQTLPVTVTNVCDGDCNSTSVSLPVTIVLAAAPDLG